MHRLYKNTMSFNIRNLLEILGLLVSSGGPGTKPLQILMDNCICWLRLSISPFLFIVCVLPLVVRAFL